MELTKTSFDYGVKCIFNRCCQRLEYFYPTSLELWDFVQGPRPDPGLVVGLSHYINKPNFLPSAFYHLTSATTFYDVCPEHLQTYWLMRLGLQELWSQFLEQEKQCLPMYEDVTRQVKALSSKHVIDPLSQFLEYSRIVYNYHKLPYQERFRTMYRALDFRFIVWNLLLEFLPGQDVQNPCWISAYTSRTGPGIF